MKFKAVIAALAVLLSCALITSKPVEVHAQATLLPLAKQCFSANSGVNGMVGTLGPITGGSLYTNGSYGGVSLTGGSGSGATANITVSGGIVTGVAVLNPGTQYVVGDVLSASAASIGGTGSGFSVSILSTSINSAVAGGSVAYYIPSTLTTKQTWQDAGETILNSQPVPLDQNGCAIVYGSGIYRQIVKDQLGNTIWDAVTASTGSGGSTGTASSQGVMVGTILFWANTTLPPTYLYAAGARVSRTTYSQLLTAITFQANILCQSGIASITVSTAISDSVPVGTPIEASCFAPGTVVSSKSSGILTMSTAATATASISAVLFPWGAGDGSTTFNLPDYRGTVPVGRNNMESNTSPRLNSTYYGQAGNPVDPNAVNARGGLQNHAPILNETATGIISNNTAPLVINSASVATNVVFGSLLTNSNGSGINITTLDVGAGIGQVFSSATLGVGGTPVTSDNTGGQPFSVVQPSLTSDFIIKALPDDAPTGPGVSSIGGMTGIIACGSGLTCNANTISVNVGTIYLPLAGGTMSGGINMGGNAIVNGGAITGAAITGTSYAGLPQATNAVKGVMEGDGATISCVTGVCTAVGGATTAVAVGTTTVGGATTNGFCLSNGNGTLGNVQCLSERGGVLNGTITATASAGAITFALKNAAGNNPSAADPVFVAFPNTNAYVVLPVTSALSMTIASGSTLGVQSSSTGTRLAIEAMNNAGTVVLAVGNFPSPPSSDTLVYNTTACCGTAGNSTETLYTPSALSSVTAQPIAYAIFGALTPGTWTTPTSVSMWTTDRAAMPYDLTTRPETPPSQFSGAIFRPKAPNSLQYLDLGVNGTPTPTVGEGLLGWYDTCDADLIANPQANTACSRLAVDGSHNTIVGNYAYGPSPPNGDIFFYAGGIGRVKIFASNGSMQPVADNVSALGFTSNRWTAVYAVNGTIQTSDAREKMDLAPIDDRVLHAIDSIQVKQWKWIEGDGKTNFGPTVQDIDEAFKKDGLSIDDYGMITRDEKTGHFGLNYAQFNLLRNEADRYYSLSNIPHRIAEWVAHTLH